MGSDNNNNNEYVLTCLKWAFSTAVVSLITIGVYRGSVGWPISEDSALSSENSGKATSKADVLVENEFKPVNITLQEENKEELDEEDEINDEDNEEFDEESDEFLYSDYIYPIHDIEGELSDQFKMVFNYKS